MTSHTPFHVTCLGTRYPAKPTWIPVAIPHPLCLFVWVGARSTADGATVMVMEKASREGAGSGGRRRSDIIIQVREARRVNRQEEGERK